MSNIDDILAGIPVIREQHAFSDDGVHFTLVDMVDKAYADRLEALCRKLYEQRNEMVMRYFNSCIPNRADLIQPKIEQFNTELAAIAKGGAK